MAKLLRAALAALSAGEGKYAVQCAENIKLECLLCVTRVLQLELAAHSAGKSSDVITMFPLLGNLLAVLLDGAVTERHKPCRLACLQAIDANLLALSGRDVTHSLHTSPSLVEPCPWRLSKLFPGTIAALVRVAMGDFKQGSKVTAASVKALQTALHACANDEILVTAGLLHLPRPRTVHDLLQPQSPAVAIPCPWDPQWLTLCREKVAPRINDVIHNCGRHAHWRVRHAVANLADQILSTSAETLPTCRPAALDTLFALAEDDLSEVSSAATAVMNRLQSDAESRRKVSSTLLPSFTHILVSLPRTARFHDSDRLVHELRRLCGLLTVLRQDLDAWLALDGHVQRLLTCLVQVCEMDVTSSAIGGQPLHGPAHAQYYRPPFRHLLDPVMFTPLLNRVASCVLQLGSGKLDVVNMACRTAKVGLGGRFREEAISLLGLLLSQSRVMGFVEAEHQGLVLPVFSAMVDLLPGHGCIVALALEALASAAEALGASCFRRHVFRALFPVVECLASDDVSVRQASFATLSRFQCVLEQPVVSTDGVVLVSRLLSTNVDYVIDGLCSRLRALNRYPNTPAVAECIARHCDVNMFVMMEDVVNCVLDGLSVVESASDALSLLRVLSGLMVSCARASDGSDSSVKGDEGNDGDDSADEALDSGKSWSALVVAIARAAAELLGADDGHVVHAAFTVIRHCFTALSNRKSVLFPLLHKVWPHLTARLKCLPTSNASRIALDAALDTVCDVLTDPRYAEFLRHRFLETVWPPLAAILRKGCPWASATSLRLSDVDFQSFPEHTTQDGIVLSLSTQERMLARVLQALATIASHDNTCAMVQTVVWDVCCACLPYLAHASPVQLQRDGVLLMRSLHRVDPDAVWLFVSRCNHRRLLCPPAHMPWLPSSSLGVDTKQIGALKWTGYSGLQAGHVAAQIQSLSQQLS